jgi:hypothetical protein
MEQQITLNLKKLIYLALFLAIWGSAGEAIGWGQGNTNVQQAPDCQVTFAFTAPGTSPTIYNYGPNASPGGNGTDLCDFWILGYAVANTGGSVSGLSLVVQSAPAGTSQTTPGTWVTYAGTLSTGSNPNTSTTGAQSTFANGTVSIPFVRVNLTSLTATGTTVVYGILQGWNFGNAAGGGGGGGGGSGCPGTVATPCITGAENSSAAAVTDYICDQTAAITISGSGLTQIVAASAGKKVRICHINFSNSAESNVTIEEGTGSNCGTGTTTVSGVYQSVLSFALDFSTRDAPVFGSGDAVCLNFVSSVTAGGLVQYAQF